MRQQKHEKLPNMQRVKLPKTGCVPFHYYQRLVAHLFMVI